MLFGLATLATDYIPVAQALTKRLATPVRRVSEKSHLVQPRGGLNRWHLHDSPADQLALYEL